MLIFDASALLAIFSDICRPDLIYMFCKIYRQLVVTQNVYAEVADPRSRSLLDGFIEGGSIATLCINTPEEVGEFVAMHRGMGMGESDVILACQKIASGGGDATGVLDDRKGRDLAEELGIAFTGLWGLLLDLRGRGDLDAAGYRAIIAALRASKFRIPRSA